MRLGLIATATRRRAPSGALLLVAVLLLEACQSGREDTGSAVPAGDQMLGGAGETVHVPRSVRSDCSVAVEGEIMAFLRSVRDGSTVVFPSGACYAQDRTVLVEDRADLIIDGRGSTFKKRTLSDPSGTSTPNWRVAGGRHVTLKNMVVEGSYSALKRGVPGQGQFTDHGVSLWGAADASVLDLRVSNVDGECVTADSDIRKGTDYRLNPPSTNVTIDRLHCVHAARQGVAATAVDGFTVSNSWIDDAQQNGVDIEIDAPGELARNVKILDNKFGGLYFSAIAVPLGDSPDVGNVLIRGNRMQQAPDTCYPAVYIGDPRFRLREITIVDNVLLTVGDGVRLIQVDSGEVARNTITKVNPGNTACDNVEFEAPHSSPVRLVDSAVRLEANVVTGFAA